MQFARYSGLFYRICNLAPNHILLMLYYSLVYSRIQYGIILWGSTFKSVLREVEVRLNNIVRTIIGSRKFDHITPLFKRLKFLKLHDIYQLELGKFMYQLNWNKLPIIIQSLFTKIEDLHKYNTRQAKTTKLFLPRVSKQMAKTQLSFRGPQHWSLIPSNIKNFFWTIRSKKSIENTLSIAINLIQYESD